ncbi:unnamed protein product, partial [Rotaria sp. Silwood2]
SNSYTPFPFTTRQNGIRDDYDISTEELGAGISGRVFKCEHCQTKRKYALKNLIDSPRVRQEVILHKKACKDCQYIVQIEAVYENMLGPQRHILIIMECMEGGELFSRIEKRGQNPYTERDAARYIWMIVQAVNHLHKMDIAHRDLKPENLLLTDESDDAILKLSDFGFAKEGHNESLPLHTPLFTSYYVVPEILKHNKYDKACDIWSLGVIMYILLCGYPPFYPEGNRMLSSGMKNRITAGAYEYPEREWENISSQAKSTINQMLTVDTALRITIDEVLKCSWLTELTSTRPIHMVALQDEEDRRQLEVAVASATDSQRRTDDDLGINISGPEASRIARRAAKRKQQNDATNVKQNNESNMN